MISPLKGLSKPKDLRGLPGLGRPAKQPPLPNLEASLPTYAVNQDDELLRLSNLLGDPRLAKKLIHLKAKKYPDATLPELVALEWLERRQIPFVFQQWLLGGRAIRGGQVVDMVVDAGPEVLIWEIQGDYWHQRPGQPQMDEAQKFALMGLTVFGKRVKAVVSLWERRLMNKQLRQPVLEMAMSGIELGR